MSPRGDRVAGDDTLPRRRRRQCLTKKTLRRKTRARPILPGGRLGLIEARSTAKPVDEEFIIVRRRQDGSRSANGLFGGNMFCKRDPVGHGVEFHDRGFRPRRRQIEGAGALGADHAAAEMPEGVKTGPAALSVNLIPKLIREKNYPHTVCGSWLGDPGQSEAG